MKAENYTILVVDDDVDYLFQLEMQLKKLGYKVITADGEIDAQKVLSEVKPDLAILDLMMENDDSGFVLAYKIKKKFPKVPVIIATAVVAETGFSFNENGDEDNSWIKADLFLEKGIKTDLLNKEIIKLLNY